MADVSEEIAGNEFSPIKEEVRVNEEQTQSIAPAAEVKDELTEKIVKAAIPRYLSSDAEFMNAKSFLSSKVGVKHAVSVYDHITELIMNVLEKKDTNAVDNFEQLSLSVKNNHFSIPSEKVISIINNRVYMLIIFILRMQL